MSNESETNSKGFAARIKSMQSYGFGSDNVNRRVLPLFLVERGKNPERIREQIKILRPGIPEEALEFFVSLRTAKCSPKGLSVRESNNR